MFFKLVIMELELHGNPDLKTADKRRVRNILFVSSLRQVMFVIITVEVTLV